MPTSKLDQLCTEIMELTSQPDLAVIRRRARRHRVRRHAAAGVAAGVVGAIMLVGGAALSHGSASRPHPADNLPTPGPTPSGLVLFPEGPIRWADVGDAQHVYAVLSECGDCAPRLVGSDDGGRTWTVRSDRWASGPIEVRGPRTLVTTGSSMTISTDGGRTWSVAVADPTPVPSVPAGGWLMCTDLPGGHCAPTVVDPAHGRLHPLATLPAVNAIDVPFAPDAAGLWIEGREPNGTPSVAVSHDRGVTWSVHAFTGLPSGNGGMVNDNRAHVVTRDQTTAYAVCGNGIETRGFRSTDGGVTWQPTNGGAQLPGPLAYIQPSTVLPDGTHVLQQQGDARIQPLFGRQGGDSYVAESRPGWPTVPLHLAVDGSLVGADHRSLYLSTDGRTWTTATPG